MFVLLFADVRSQSESFATQRSDCVGCRVFPPAPAADRADAEPHLHPPHPSAPHLCTVSWKLCSQRSGSFQPAVALWPLVPSIVGVFCYCSTGLGWRSPALWLPLILAKWVWQESTCSWRALFSHPAASVWVQSWSRGDCFWSCNWGQVLCSSGESSLESSSLGGWWPVSMSEWWSCTSTGCSLESSDSHLLQKEAYCPCRPQLSGPSVWRDRTCENNNHEVSRKKPTKLCLLCLFSLNITSRCYSDGGYPDIRLRTLNKELK